MENSFSNKQYFGIICAAFSIFFWGITFVSTKYLLRSFSPFEILLFRFFLAYVTLCILKPRRLHITQKKQEFYFMLAGFSGVTAYQLIENMALSYTSASNVSIIVSVCPIFTAIFSQIFLKDKNLSISFVLGFILAITGISLVSFNGVVVFHLSPKGDLLALTAALLWALYSLCVSKINSFGLESILVTRRVFQWALIFMTPIAVFSSFRFGTGAENGITHNISLILDSAFNKERFSNPLNWLNFCFLGLGASAFCFVAWNIACDRLGTVRATVGIYLNPVITIIFAFFALGEKISLMGGIGAVLTISGLFVSELKKRKQF